MLHFNFYQTGGTPVKVVFADDKSDNLVWLADHTSFSSEKLNAYYLPVKDEPGTLYLSLGKKEDIDLHTLRLAGFQLAKTAKANHLSELEIQFPAINEFCNRKMMMALAEGMMQAEYKFDFYLSEKSESSDLTVNYTPEHGPQELMEKGFNRIQTIMEGVFFTRDLVNKTAGDIYPESLAQIVEETLSPLGVEIEIFDKKQIEEIGMKALLAVSQGSAKEPRFIVMKYQGNPDSAEFTGLVGKGVTYDSGGYSIKTSQGMSTMHCDMGGSGTVIGSIYALAKLKAKSNVYGVVAACENMISGSSFKVGEVISSLSGKSIEIGNTDAEGRLTLADAIFYATDRLKVDRVIDLATLTGACVVALGDEYSGIITNNQDFFAELQNAADLADEKIWQLPNDKKIAENNKSKVADICNTGGRLAGTVSAGQFVGFFLADKEIPWVHMDIAGTAYLSKAKEYLPERATGIHVKTLVNLLNPMEECHSED